MSERPSDRWVSIGFSIGVHGLIVGLFAFGYWYYQRRPPEPQLLAIEATVVDAQSLPAGTLPPLQEPEPVATVPVEEQIPEPEPEAVPEPEPEPEPAPDPGPTPEEVERQQAEQQREQVEREKAEREKAEREKAEVAEATAKQKEQQRLAAEKKAREDAERKKREEAEKLAREKSERDKAEREKLERERAARAAADRQRETDLRAQIAAEERAAAAARNSAAMAQYVAQIAARIERAWIRPATARSGLSCEVRVSQVPGGEVVGVQVGACNGDEVVKQSIEAAVYRASPLPLPSDPALFERNLVVTFRPQD